MRRARSTSSARARPFTLHRGHTRGRSYSPKSR
jgi:hypothetical protein